MSSDDMPMSIQAIIAISNTNTLFQHSKYVLINTTDPDCRRLKTTKYSYYDFNEVLCQGLTLIMARC